MTLAALKDVMRQLVMTLFATVRAFAVCPSLMVTLVVALKIVFDLSDDVLLTCSGSGGGVLIGGSVTNGWERKGWTSDGVRGGIFRNDLRLCGHSGSSIDARIQCTLRRSEESMTRVTSEDLFCPLLQATLVPLRTGTGSRVPGSSADVAGMGTAWATADVLVRSLTKRVRGRT